MRDYKRRPEIDRFLEKVEPLENGCIKWTAWTDKDGYGRFKRAGRSGLNVMAHRFAYEYYVGTITSGLEIDHLCRNRSCINPDHLEVVTPKEHTLRGKTRAAANSKKTHCPQGHPYKGDNLYLTPEKGRSCRECRKEAQKRYRNRTPAKKKVCSLCGKIYTANNINEHKRRMHSNEKLREAA